MGEVVAEGSAKTMLALRAGGDKGDRGEITIDEAIQSPTNVKDRKEEDTKETPVRTKGGDTGSGGGGANVSIPLYQREKFKMTASSAPASPFKSPRVQDTSLEVHTPSHYHEIIALATSLNTQEQQQHDGVGVGQEPSQVEASMGGGMSLPGVLNGSPDLKASPSPLRTPPRMEKGDGKGESKAGGPSLSPPTTNLSAVERARLVSSANSVGAAVDHFNQGFTGQPDSTDEKSVMFAAPFAQKVGGGRFTPKPKRGARNAPLSLKKAADNPVVHWPSGSSAAMSDWGSLFEDFRGDKPYQSRRPSNFAEAMDGAPSSQPAVVRSGGGRTRRRRSTLMTSKEKAMERTRQRAETLDRRVADVLEGGGDAHFGRRKLRPY